MKPRGMEARPSRPRWRAAAAWSGLVLAAALWYVMFVVQPGNFWLMMAVSTTVLAVLGLAGRPGMFTAADWTGRNVLLGVVSALVLYGVFRAGHWGLMVLAGWFPGLMPDVAAQVDAVYADRALLPAPVVALLLFFPIGFGEEVFWRGLVQHHFQDRLGPLTGFLAATAAYTAVHLPTANPVLAIAAVTGGLFWGGLYWKTGSIVPPLVSHMVWDPLIFVFLPLQ